ncbi:solute carrier family 45 member 4 [Hippoglossus stenolepis]|uniref:solute carrier family 45 member 4 n=1 Tax=Hippoglossus stenolepis TaxID=195615 RepID=UPI00159C3061|nr:solute carrier family 45 member 4 [Hippoglossus stenolepis]XP_035037994.1 solute carrier family 45 member 4 [Hippoglossus stenolepis]XP_035037995.1 solute carrier family 45 member 4 [Hippoglossus stenolepis]XP_035037996.1 solute carrier family 45 member 4 [Hippoglossus stenolepis]
MLTAMPPQNTEADAMQVGSLVGGVNDKNSSASGLDGENGGTGGKADGSGGGGGGTRGGGEEVASEESIEGITMKRWLMHGAVMFGREFCYAMETALVTPVLLQIGLPEQYYSLTWFLSPVLGLMFTPLIGSASDRCTLRWGRRRPFILALCIGTLIGVALFLNGSLIGLSLGDEQGKQPIGIVLTVLGVVVLDFCADATEGPIRAYLLDVADTDEQDMALNIHAASAGLGGAVGYALGGLDWTHTFLGSIFKSQEQILFVFAAILFSVSVVLHLFSIEEQQYSPQHDRLDQESPDPNKKQLSSNGKAAILGPKLEMIGENETMDSYDLYDPYEDDMSDRGDSEMDFLEVELVRSKSDSVLAMADGDHLDHDAMFLCHLEPSIFTDRLSPYRGSPPTNSSFFNANHSTPPPRFTNIRRSSSTGSQDPLQPQTNNNHQTNALTPRISRLSAFLQEMENDDGQEALLNNQLNEQRTLNGRLLAGVTNADRFNTNSLSSIGQAHRAGMVKAASTGAPMRQSRHRHIFYRQPSCTFSYYGRVGSHRYRYRRANAASLIKPSRSMNDLYEVETRHRRRSRQRNRHRSGNTNSSSGDTESEEGEVETTVRLLWLSMLKMPPELLRLCACHLLTWFSIIAEAVFFTDFMGQVIYHGDPTAPANSTLLENYHRGVQMGCWGLVIYAMTAATCSALLQKYLDNFDLSIKVIYILGTLAFSIGTAVMAIFPNVYVSMVMISTMGIISMSISYCPYALLGQYHEMKQYIQHSPGNSRRGFGIDCAILSCQVYISQIMVASGLGAVVEAVGSVRVIPLVASGGSLLGFFTACFLVIYPSPNSGGGDSAKASEKRALKKPENPNSTAVAVVKEKPSFLKLNKEGKATTTTTSCHTENESAL